MDPNINISLKINLNSCLDNLLHSILNNFSKLVTDDQREKRIGIIGAVKLLPAVKRKRVIKVLGKKKKKD